MPESGENQLIRRSTEGQKLAEKLSQNPREDATALFNELIVLAENGHMQIEMLTRINEDLCKAVETGDSDLVRKRIIELKLGNPLPLPIKL